jgi:hypothetical protein
MKAMRAVAAVIVITALFACKKKTEEALPDAAPSAPPVEIDAAPPPPMMPEVIDAGVDVGVVRTVTVVKKDGGTTDAGQVKGQGGAAPIAIGGTAGLAINTQCVGNCVKKFGECIAAAKDLEANKKCRTDMVACRKTCTGI